MEAQAIFKLAQDKGRDCADLAAGYLAREAQSDVLPLLRELLRDDGPVGEERLLGHALEG